MTDMPDTASGASREPVFTPPSLPKGGGTLAPGSGMLSIGGADGAAGWMLPLPLPQGRTLSPTLALNYSSSGGNGAFGAGWHCAPPTISRMTRLGIPLYTDSDRLLGPDGEEILPDEGGSSTQASLPFASVSALHHVTPWVRRSGGRDERLEHWRADAHPDSPGFWLHYHADGSITLYGWSASARLADPLQRGEVACWYAEETVTPTGEHVVYTYREEDDAGCDDAELAAHGQASNLYLSAVHAMNATPSEALLIPAGAFRADDFMTLMLFDYGERGTTLDMPPPFQASAPWPLREDCFSHWRWGFDQRVRRLCHDILLWHRTAMMAGEADPTPALVSRLHLTYEPSGVTTLLVAAQQAAYEADGQLLALPPVEFEPNRPGRVTSGWDPLPALDGFNAPRWQLADLYGDGLPGLLYQDGAAWWYREPQRDPKGGVDAVTWSDPQPLPVAPGCAPGTGLLVDLEGSGRPQWLVNLPGLRGSFTLAPDGRWSEFITAESMPVELGHPAAQLADLSGGGCQDLVMIGPRSVRLNAKMRKPGWQPAQQIDQDHLLPLAGGEHRLVAFADLSGSGLQQLTEIDDAGVRYWPSCGHGQFARPIHMPGFGLDDFVASRVLLGDSDGSGTTDILYVEPGRIRVFINQAGNRFVEGPCVPAPDGITFDDTCKLQLVDLCGHGTAQLVLTVAHDVPRSWSYRFNDRRPWLLAEVCSNNGSRVLFDYRSSAQGWLDEKVELQRQGKVAMSHLPFPVHALCQVTTLDDINGLRTTRGMRYRRGVWDHEEREFRGFTRCVQTDTLADAQGSSAERSPPAQIHHWYLSGGDADAVGTPEAFAESDSAEAAFAVRALRFTRLEGEREVPFEPDVAARRWLLRALRGKQLRSETYGMDGSALASVPYAIERQRWQIRAYPTAHPDRPAALVTAVETLKLTTERIAADPLVSQAVVLAQDAHGHVLRQVEINYPRQSAITPSPYPDHLPEGLEAASRDAQQNILWLHLQRVTVHNLTLGATHVCGLADTRRTDVLALSPLDIAPGGFGVENLQQADGPLARLDSATLASYSRVQWCDSRNRLVDVPQRQALVAFTDSAVLDDSAVQQLRANLPPREIAPWLAACGYHRLVLPEDQRVVEAGRHGLARYHSAQKFYRPAAVWDSEMQGQLLLDWSAGSVAVVSMTDAAGLQTCLQHDWRFVTPVALTDPNQKVHWVTLDALGRVVQSRFHGNENGRPAGYHSTRAFVLPDTVEGMLELKGGEVPVATAHRVVSDSWMPLARDEEGHRLPGRMGELALRRRLASQKLAPRVFAEGRLPPHVITLQTDRYDGDPAQQLRLRVDFSDGAGRSLQSAVLSAPGEAMVRTAEGGLAVDAAGKALFAPAAVRWAVSGRTEYDNKGQAIRTWLPFYLDDWRPMRDDNARDGLYADTHLYDALGRVYRVLTAAGRERRTQFYPWFTVLEDENDTVQ